MNDIDAILEKGQVAELFLSMSLLEHALIRAGFRKKIVGIARVDWSSFCECLGKEFISSLTQNPDVRVLWDEPAKQLCVVDNDQLDWLPRVKTRLEKENPLVEIIWVRHCVFHGESQIDTPRHTKLRKAAIKAISVIVEQCSKSGGQLADVAHIFERTSMQIR